MKRATFISVIGRVPGPCLNVPAMELPSGVSVVGTNLLNEEVRNHVSFLKDSVLMPGAGVRVFATIKY